MSTQAVPTYTPAEYLALERESSDGKREYRDGRIYLRSGASREHNRICASLAKLVGLQIEGKPCDVFFLDMRVKVSEYGHYCYPDMAIVCGQAEFEDDLVDTLLNPSAIVEVLSDSTEACDRGEKFESYRQLPSLREYLLIDQHRPKIEHYLRLDGGAWRFSPIAGTEGEVQLATGGVRLALAEVYAKIDFAAAEDQ